MNRRHFLYSSAASFAASRKSASSESANDVKLGVATYSFHEFQRDFRVKNVKKLGIEYVDVNGFHLPQNDSAAILAQGRAEFNKAGLRVTGGGNVSHCAAAPTGSTVSFRAELISMEENPSTSRCKVEWARRSLTKGYTSASLMCSRFAGA